MENGIFQAKRLVSLSVAASLSLGIFTLTAPDAAAYDVSGMLSSSRGTADYSASRAADLNAQEAEIINLVNQHRANNGLAPLAVSAELSASAKQWSQRMASDGRLYHSGLNLGENCGQGSYNMTPQEIVQMWIDSPGHNANLLNPDYSVIGAGIVIDSKGQTWSTTQFYF